jgi:hypothetical protein
LRHKAFRDRCLSSPRLFPAFFDYVWCASIQLSRQQVIAQTMLKLDFLCLVLHVV